MKESKNLSRAKTILEQNPSIDMHSHLGYWEGKGLTDIFQICEYLGDDQMEKNVNQMLTGQCKAVYLAITSDNPLLDLTKPGNKTRDYKGNEAFDEYKRQMGILEDFCQRYPMEVTTDINQIEAINQKGNLAVVLTSEGGHMVQEDLKNLEILYADGLRRFQPIHYVHTKLGDSQTDPSAFGGLSPLGKEAMKEAVRLGMVVDVAHAGFECAKDMIDIAHGPVMLSHTLMKYGPYMENRARWVTPRHAHMIAECGGVIGSWVCGPPYGVPSADDFAVAVSKLVDEVGINHVAWATDYINPAMPDWFQNYENFPVVCGALLDVGFSDEDLIKFIGGNTIRVQNEILGK